MTLFEYSSFRAIESANGANRRPNTDQTALEGFARHEALEHILPLAIERVQRAIAVDAFPVLFMSELKTGRRCSCYMGTDSPSGFCRACFGTGKAGGYHKYGTHLHMLDITATHSSINIEPYYRTKPNSWMLVNGALSGSIFWNVSLTNNTGVLDLWSPYTAIDDTKTSGISFFVKAPSDGSFVALTEASLTARLTAKTFIIRVDFNRKHSSIQSPMLISALLRYYTIQSALVNSDWQKLEESVTMTDEGYIDTISTPQIQLDNTLKLITANDWFYRPDYQTYWKVERTEPYRPFGGILVSHQVAVRQIQTSIEKNYYNYPLGKIQ